MVTSATGGAASPSMAMVRSSGAGSTSPSAEARAPSAMDQGSGLTSMPRSAWRSAIAMPWAPAPSSRESAMHKELVITMSMAMVCTTGPAAPAPSNAAMSGTPMKPVLGKVVTRAPKAESFQFQPPRRAIRRASEIITRAEPR